VISGKADIKVSSDGSKFNLKGIIYSTADSSFFNIFGPLGINVAKVRIDADSVFIIDTQHKRCYKSFSKDISKNVFGLFKGRFSDDMAHLVCTLFNFANRNPEAMVNCDNVNGPITFNYRASSGKLVFSLIIKNALNSHMITFKVLPTSENVGFFDISKYKSYEIINIKLI
jgi:hypothetical protein